MTNRTEELRNFYRGKRVYITGVTGFKGTWLALLMKELGAKVFGMGLLPEENSLATLVKLDEQVHVVYGDITAPADNSVYVNTMAHFRPDVVFHLAAQALVSVGYDDPFTTFNTNIMGTVITHEVVKGLGKKVSLVNVTTDKVYQEKSTPALETDILRGYDPYSLSKSCSDMISQCYQECFEGKGSNISVSTMRGGNVLGGGDYSKNRIIPDIVRASISGETLKLRNPDSIRPYQHVLDVLLAYVTIGMKQYEDKKFAATYNVGPSHEGGVITKKLVTRMNEVLPFSYEVDPSSSIGHENPLLQLDSSLIRRETAWSPIYDTYEEVIDETSKWYSHVDIKKDKTALTETITEIKKGLSLYEN